MSAPAPPRPPAARGLLPRLARGGRSLWRSPLGVVALCTAVGGAGAAAVRWTGRDSLNALTRPPGGIASPLRPVAIVRRPWLAAGRGGPGAQALGLDALGDRRAACVDAAAVVIQGRRAAGWRDALDGLRVAAYVLPGRDTIFLSTPPDRVPPEAAAHEWVHVIQGQYGDLEGHLDGRPTYDGWLAAKAVVEGVASVVTAAEGDGGGHLATRFPRPPYSGDLGGNLHRLVLQEGAAWVASRYAGMPLTMTYAPPPSTYELLFPGRDSARTADPPPPPSPAWDERVVCSEVLGPLAVATALRARGLEYAGVARLAPQWRGDRVTVFERMAGDSVARRTVWEVRWDPAAGDAGRRWWDIVVGEARGGAGREGAERSPAAPPGRTRAAAP